MPIFLKDIKSRHARVHSNRNKAQTEAADAQITHRVSKVVIRPATRFGYTTKKQDEKYSINRRRQDGISFETYSSFFQACLELHHQPQRKWQEKWFTFHTRQEWTQLIKIANSFSKD